MFSMNAFSIPRLYQRHCIVTTDQLKEKVNDNLDGGYIIDE